MWQLSLVDNIFFLSVLHLKSNYTSIIEKFKIRKQIQCTILRQNCYYEAIYTNVKIPRLWLPHLCYVVLFHIELLFLLLTVRYSDTMRGGIPYHILNELISLHS